MRLTRNPKTLGESLLGIIFELRGKPFGLRDSGQSESIYTLCRKWMYGKDEEPEKTEEAEYPPPSDSSLVSFQVKTETLEDI